MHLILGMKIHTLSRFPVLEHVEGAFLMRIIMSCTAGKSVDADEICQNGLLLFAKCSKLLRACPMVGYVYGHVHYIIGIML